MALKIRLRRVGAKKQPAYRIVIADARAPRDGRFIEIVGAYNPLTNPATVSVNDERALYWLRQGAQPTDVVKNLFEKRSTVWAQFTGQPIPEAAAPAEAAPVVEAPAAAEEAAPVAEAPAAAEEAAPEAEKPAAE